MIVLPLVFRVQRFRIGSSDGFEGILCGMVGVGCNVGGGGGMSGGSGSGHGGRGVGIPGCGMGSKGGFSGRANPDLTLRPGTRGSDRQAGALILGTLALETGQDAFGTIDCPQRQRALVRLGITRIHDTSFFKSLKLII
jgi:hypothetical protein